MESSNTILKIGGVVLVLGIVVLLFLLKTGTLNVFSLNSVKQSEEGQHDNMIQELSNEQVQYGLLFQTAERPTLTDTCSNVLEHNSQEYYAAWKSTLKEENNLSEEDYDNNIRIKSVLLKGVRENCDLVINTIVKQGWFFVNHINYFNVVRKNSPTITPDALVAAAKTGGRMETAAVGNSDINLSFKDLNEVVNFYVRKYNIGKYSEINFVNGNTTAVDPVLVVRGTIDSSKNKCLEGSIGLVTQQTTYSEFPCASEVARDPLSF